MNTIGKMSPDGQGQDVVLENVSPNRTKKWIISIAALAAVACLYTVYQFTYAFLSADTYFNRAKLRTAVVQAGRFERNVPVEGEVVSTRNATLYAEATGHVSLRVKEGEAVSKGQLLAELDNPELASELDQARTSLTSMKAELERLEVELTLTEVEMRQSEQLLRISNASERRELERMSKIKLRSAISQNDYEKLKDRILALDVQLNHATETIRLTEDKHKLDIRTKQLKIEEQSLLVQELARQTNRLLVRAPFNGMLGRIEIKDRDKVVLNDPILTVVDLGSYEVEVLVPQSYADSLKVGLAGVINHRNIQQPATLTRISPQVQNGSVPAVLSFDGPAPEGLRQHLRLNAKIILESIDNAVTLKRGAFLESHGGYGIYVLSPDGNTSQYRRISVGAIGTNEVQIISGLKVGERAIVSNTAELAGAEDVRIVD